MARTYTPEFRAQALARLELNDGALRLTARELGIAAPMLQRWRDANRIAAIVAGTPVPDTVTDVTAKTRDDWDFVAILSARFAQALDLLAEKLPQMQARDLAVATGILSDKLLDHRDGRANRGVSIDNRQQTLSLPPGLTLAELQALAAGSSE